MPKTPQDAAALVPHLTVDDAAGALEFYRKAFGATEVQRHAAPDGKKIMHATFLVNGAPVMINDDFPEFSGKPGSPRALGGSPVTLHLNVPDVDAAWKRAVKAGAAVVMPLADQFWGDRYGQVRDPFGHLWSLSSKWAKPTDDDVRRGAEEAWAKARVKLGVGKGRKAVPAAAAAKSTAKAIAKSVAKAGAKRAAASAKRSRGEKHLCA